MRTIAALTRKQLVVVLGLSLLALGSCSAPRPRADVVRGSGPAPSAQPSPSLPAATPPPGNRAAALAEQRPRANAACAPGPGTGTIRGKVAFADGSVPAAFTGYASRYRPGWRTSGECDHQLEDFPLAGGAAGELLFEGLPPGIYDLIVSGAGLVDHHIDPFVVEAGQIQDVGVRILDRGRVLRGRVLDAAGIPVAGAVVLAGDLLWGNARGFSASSPQAITTGPDGRFTVTALARGSLVVVAQHPVLGSSAAVRLAMRDAEMTTELRLRSTGGLAGTVTRAGKPAPADLTARPVGLGRAVTLTSTTDAQGRYRFEQLAEGSYVITAQLVRDGVHALAFPAKTGQVSISASAEARLDLAIPEGTLLVVTAKLAKGAADMVTATLVQGAFAAKTNGELERALENLDVERARQEQVHLAEKATLELADVPAGSYTLCGVATRYIDSRAEIEARAARCSAVVVENGRARQEVTLSVPGR